MLIALRYDFSSNLPHAFIIRTYVYKGGETTYSESPNFNSTAVNLIGESGTCFAVSLAEKFAYKYPV